MTYRFAWFAPNAGIWISQQMEHRVANALVDAGHEVLMVQCDGVLDAYCPVMSAAGLSAGSPSSERARTCRDCRHAAGVTRGQARYRTVQLSELLSPEDAAAADRIVAEVMRDTWSDVVVDGIPIGVYATYTTLLHHKVPAVTDTDAAWAEYRADLRGALLTAAAMPALLERIEPTHAVVYNALYPANRVFAEAMRSRGAVLLNVSGGPTVPRRYSTLAVYDGLTASQTVVDSPVFVRSMELPCDAVEVRAVEHHVGALMSGSDPWVYSGAATGESASRIRSKLDLRSEAPVVTVLLSSLDETRSYTLVDAIYTRPDHKGFSEPGEFIRACVEAAQRNPAVDFVFRLHPRLVPNKRDSITSPDLAAIHGLLDDLPANCTVNHPSDGISIYDLVLISAAAINHSSSAGLEFLAFGVPVIQYDPGRSLLYPLDFSFAVERRDSGGLDAALADALAAGFDLTRSIRAFRWYATLQVRTVVHLDPLPDPDDPLAPAPGSPHAPPAGRHPVGRLLPRGLRERAARILHRRARAATVDSRPLSPGAVTALLGSIDSAERDDEIWKPYLVAPQDGDETREAELVRAALTRLARRLDLDDEDGLGVLASAGLRSP